MRKTIATAFIIIALVSFSCKKEIKPGETAAVKAANGWWVTFTLNGSDVYGLGTFFLNTYNTSANDDSLWVDDLKNSWGFKSKVKIDYATLTFSAADSKNWYYDPVNNFTALTATFTDGKILTKAGKSRSGNPTDSIYFKANFSDDPSNTYVISGTARTGFIEDDY